MDNLKKVALVVVILLSIVGLIISLAGVAGIWKLNNTLTTEAVTGALDKTETALEALEDSLNSVVVALDKSRGALEIVDQAAIQAGDKIENNTPVANLISNTVGDELYPAIVSILDTIRGIRSTIIAVNASIEAANAIPFVSIPTLPMDRLQTVDEKAANVLDGVLAFRAEIAALKSGTAEVLVSSVSTQTSNIDDDLAILEDFATSYRDDVNDVSTALATVRSKAPGLLDLTSVVLTVILLWFAVGQAGLAIFSWKALKNAA